MPENKNESMFKRGAVKLRFASDVNSGNFGDLLSYYLVKKLGIDVEKYTSKTNEVHLSAIGSVLGRAEVWSPVIIWGSGFLSPQTNLMMQLQRVWQFLRGKYGKPCVYAVRGNQTADILKRAGIICPDVFGDPALLMPLLYQTSNVKKDSKVGVVLHRKHAGFKEKFSAIDGVKVINVNRNIDEIEQFVDDINSCEAVLSSSLHGLIIANAYKVPCMRLKLNDSSIHNKSDREDFKFHDYLSGLNYGVTDPTLRYQFATVITNSRDINNDIVEHVLENASVPDFDFQYQNLLESFSLAINKCLRIE